MSSVERGMESLRDYQALRWWVVLPLFAFLFLMNLPIFIVFGLAWAALPALPDLSILLYILPGVRQTYENFAACGRADLGSLYAGLQVFSVTGAVVLDVALIRALTWLLPIYRTKKLIGKKVLRRTAASAFWCFLIAGATIFVDFEVFACDHVSDRKSGIISMLSLSAALFSMTASRALRNPQL